MSQLDPRIHDSAALLVAARRWARLLGVNDLEEAELAAAIEAIVRRKKILEIGHEGLVTRSEAANLLLAHLQTWLVNRGTKKWLPMPEDKKSVAMIHALNHEIARALLGPGR